MWRVPAVRVTRNVCSSNGTAEVPTRSIIFSSYSFFLYPPFELRIKRVRNVLGLCANIIIFAPYTSSKPESGQTARKSDFRWNERVFTRHGRAIIGYLLMYVDTADNEIITKSGVVRPPYFYAVNREWEGERIYLFEFLFFSNPNKLKLGMYWEKIQIRNYYRVLWYIILNRMRTV